MNIYSAPGTKVKYLDYGGYDYGIEKARRAGFISGELYEIQEIKISTWHTWVAFKEIPGWYNSVMFADFN